MSVKSPMRKLAAPLAAGALLLGACGDSDGGGGDVAAFCDMSAELEASAQAGNFEFPSADELQAAADAAPSEIRDEMQTLVDAFGRLEEGDVSVLQEPEIQEASEVITAFEAERCGTGTDEGAAADDALAGLEDDLPEGAEELLSELEDDGFDGELEDSGFEDGAGATGSAELPADFPDDVPVPDGARIRSASSAQGDMTVFTEVDTHWEEIYALYQEQLPANGWEILGDRPFVQKEGTELDARKDDVDLTVGISSHDDGPTTVYFNIVTS